MLLEYRTFLFIWIYDVVNYDLFINHTCNAIMKKNICTAKYYNYPALVDKIWAFSLYLKVSKLSYPTMFTGTVLNTLGPDYYVLRIIQEAKQVFYLLFYLARNVASDKFSSSENKNFQIREKSAIYLLFLDNLFLAHISNLLII